MRGVVPESTVHLPGTRYLGRHCLMDLGYLEGKKFCVVFVKQEDDTDPNSKIKMKCIHGRANVNHRGKLIVESPATSFTVPATACNRVLPSDGTSMLKDAEFFVICKVSGMEL
jgi:hypothetical protein